MTLKLSLSPIHFNITAFSAVHDISRYLAPVGEPSQVACATVTSTPGRDDWMQL